MHWKSLRKYLITDRWKEGGKIMGWFGPRLSSEPLSTAKDRTGPREVRNHNCLLLAKTASFLTESKPTEGRRSTQD